VVKIGQLLARQIENLFQHTVQRTRRLRQCFSDQAKGEARCLRLACDCRGGCGSDDVEDAALVGLSLGLRLARVWVDALRLPSFELLDASFAETRIDVITDGGTSGIEDGRDGLAIELGEWQLVDALGKSRPHQISGVGKPRAGVDTFGNLVKGDALGVAEDQGWFDRLGLWSPLHDREKRRAMVTAERAVQLDARLPFEDRLRVEGLPVVGDGDLRVLDEVDRELDDDL